MVYRLGYGRSAYSIQATEIFELWFERLNDRRAKARIQARIDRAEDGNFGDHKPIAEGVSEMRIHCGPGYRIYFKRVRSEIVILLAGGDKSSQVADVKTALRLARGLEV